MSPLVSIIVPVYNTVEYVEECIQSILSQTYRNVELILVNDGSTDGSGEICKKYESSPKVIYIEQDNLGPTAARRRGVEESHGEWIMFVDSDDMLSFNAIDSFLAASDGVDIVVGRVSNNGAAYPSIMSREEYIYMMYAKTVSSSPSAKLFRNTLFNEKSLCFNREVCRWEDWLMNLQIAIDNKRTVKTVPEVFYSYRTRSTSTSHSNVLSYDELENIGNLADEIIKDEIKSSRTYVKAKLMNRLILFQHELLLNGFYNEPHHPFVKEIKQCMDEAGVWRPMDRWLLSVSSPWAVKTVWNLRKVTRRLAHPSMIPGDIKRLLNR